MHSLRIVFIVALAALISLLTPSHGTELEFASRPVSSLPLTWNCPHTIVTQLPGITKAVHHVTLSAPLDGTVATLLVAESARVAEGQVLATLDSRDLDANLLLATATLERTSNGDRAARELELAEQTLARTRELARQGAVSQARLDADVAAVDVARSRLSEANELHREAVLRCDVVKAAIEQRTLRAPFDAIVIRVDAQVGQTIRRAEPIVTLVNLDRLTTDLHLPSSLMGSIEIGQSYQLWAAAPLDKVITAQLISKEPIVNAATKTFRCRFEIDNVATQYPAGFPVGLIDLTDAIHTARNTDDTRY